LGINGESGFLPFLASSLALFKKQLMLFNSASKAIILSNAYR